MIRKLQQYIAIFAVVIGLGAGVLLTATPTRAISVFNGSCGSSTATKSGNNNGGTNNTNSGTSSDSTSICGAAQQDTVPNLVKRVVNILLYVLGIIAVIAIIIGGIRYATANGDSSAVKSAKDTIMYAVIGLIVAIMAFTIVNFVVTQFS